MNKLLSFTDRVAPIALQSQSTMSEAIASGKWGSLAALSPISPTVGFVLSLGELVLEGVGWNKTNDDGDEFISFAVMNTEGEKQGWSSVSMAKSGKGLTGILYIGSEIQTADKYRLFLAETGTLAVYPYTPGIRPDEAEAPAPVADALEEDDLPF